MKFFFPVSFSLLLLTVSARAADVRLVFWYERARPLDTFQFQSYDLRKGQFTQDVTRWMALMARRYPHYAVYTRDIDLSREQGETDNLKIGAAIQREFLAFSAMHGATFLGYTGLPPGGTFGPKPSEPRPLPRVGNGPLNLGPGPPSFPFPMPYPRPHP